MELFLKTPSVQEPVTIDEVRSYLRLSSEQEDDTLPTLISAARAHVESITGRALLKQEWQVNLKPPYPHFSPLVRMMKKCGYRSTKTPSLEG
ncbi:MAG: phage head-tail connector protein [Alphaproteobacteria bacterium]|nr:phage head-tail connector protein [Alphaproteobacteria bacterium]